MFIVDGPVVRITNTSFWYSNGLVVQIRAKVGSPCSSMSSLNKITTSSWKLRNGWQKRKKKNEELVTITTQDLEGEGVQVFHPLFIRSVVLI